MKSFLAFLMFFAVLGEASASQCLSQNSASRKKHCQEDRIYLDHQNLVTKKEGIFLIDDANQLIRLSCLYADAQGIYTTSEGMNSDLAVVYPIFWCCTCEAYRSIDRHGHCVVCGNTP